jgi:2-polyprenyl-3-methyl-5-hydroxy-6-metoxy-1,4-benzoquinol methylase
MMDLARKHSAQVTRDVQPSLMAHSFETEATTWDDLLTHQVSIFFKRESEFLAHLPEWSEAKTVLDIGCGNGAYLARLCETFPNKNYIGIDISNSLIKIARQRHGYGNLSFRTFDIQENVWPEATDILLLRFVCQHLANPKQFFRKLRRNSVGVSHIIVAEPCLSDSYVVPELPELSNLIKRYDEMCRSLETARSTVASGEFATLCEPNWNIINTTTISSVARPSRQLSAMLHGWIAAIESTRLLTSDFSIVRENLHRWLKQEHARAQLSLKYWVLRPADPTGEVA